MRHTHFKILGGLLVATGVTASVTAAPVRAAEPTTVALLSSHFQNDHAEFEPTTDAERKRMDNIMRIFTTKLEASGKYRFVPVSQDMQSKIDKGQQVGECGGCELSYGKELGAKEVAWIEVQKVSNLILNINVYVKDVAQDKLVFMKSVDIRGNTNETWDHAMKYLIRNYMLEPRA